MLFSLRSVQRIHDRVAFLDAALEHAALVLVTHLGKIAAAMYKSRTRMSENYMRLWLLIGSF